MRRVVLPLAIWAKAPMGKALDVAVRVDWPEVQLTDEQQIANGLARGAGRTEPFPDHSIFVVTVPFPREEQTRHE